MTPAMPMDDNADLINFLNCTKQQKMKSNESKICREKLGDDCTFKDQINVFFNEAKLFDLNQQFTSI